jgi:hypothetical protein
MIWYSSVSIPLVLLLLPYDTQSNHVPNNADLNQIACPGPLLKDTDLGNDQLDAECSRGGYDSHRESIYFTVKSSETGRLVATVDFYRDWSIWDDF